MQQTLSYRNSYQRRRRKRQQKIILSIFLLLLAASLVVGFFLCREIKKSGTGDPGQQENQLPPDTEDPDNSEVPDGSDTTDGTEPGDSDEADGSETNGSDTEDSENTDTTDGSTESGNSAEPEDSTGSEDSGTEDGDSDTGNEDTDTEDSDNSDFSLENTLFIGDSRTEGLLINTGLPDATVYAVRGLAVDNIYTKEFVPNGSGGKVTVMDALKQNSFRKIYIMLGVNELGWAFDYLFIEQYTNVIKDIRERQPDAEIVIQSIIPVTKEKSDNDNIYNNPKIYEYNELIVKMAEEQGVTYADLTPAFSDANGALPAEGSVDGVHLTKSYYEKWLEYLASQGF